MSAPLPDEPAWEDGDVVADKIGIAHLRIDYAGERVWQTFNGERHREDFPIRPLRLLIRDGKPVTP